MNWDMLRLAADHIEKDLNTFEMDDFGHFDSCGTVGCVGGHIVWANDPDEFAKLIGYGDIEGRATQLLDTDEGISGSLFYGGPLQFQYINDNKDKVPAALRWMADNKVIDWVAASNAVGFVDRT